MNRTSALIEPTDGGFPFPRLDLSIAMDQDPPPLDFILPGLMAKTMGLVVAPGGYGKTQLALQLAALVACGLDTLGLGEVPRGKVLVLASEDPEPIIRMRLRKLRSFMSAEQVKAFRENATVCPCAGHTGDFMDDGETAEKIIRCGNYRLTIFDTASRWHSGEENARSDVAHVMRQAERAARETDAAILFTHHTGKQIALNGQVGEQQAARGSSVWVDEARWVGFLAGASIEDCTKQGFLEEFRKEYVRYGVSKANYCALPPDIWLCRGDSGILLPANLVRKESKSKDSNALVAKEYAEATGASYDKYFA